MGGIVRVIVRKESGEVIPMSRWTNQLPYIVSNPKFFIDETWIEEYIEKANDSIHNDPTCTLLQPDSYGIIVLDYMKKKILSSQGYCSFLKFEHISLSNDKKNSVMVEGWNKYENAKQLSLMGAINVEKYTYDIKDYKELERERIECTVDQFLENSKHELTGTKKIITAYDMYINYEFLGWELHQYDDSYRGFVNVFRDMHESEFKFTKEDIEGYQEFIDNKILDICDGTNDELQGLLLRIVRNDKIGNLLNK